MDLVRANKGVAYATVSVSLLALGLTGVLGGIALVVVPLALIVSWFWEPGTFAVERQRTLWNIVLIVFIAITAAQVFAGSQPVLQPAVDLVLVLLVAKLFQRAGARDYTQVYALTFLMMAVATVLEERIHFGLIFVVYLICCTSGFSLNQILRRTEGSSVRPETIQLSPRYLALLGAMSALLVAFSGVFFLLLPRVGIGMGAPSPVEDTVKMTGFSDTIDLGDHGALGLDRAVVLRAETDGPVGSAYWRGISFDRFDGKRWTVSSGLKRRRGVPSVDGWFEVALPDESEARTVTQRIELEPINADVIFGIADIARVTFEADLTGQRWDNVSVDRSGAVHHGAGIRQRVEYTVESRVTGGNPAKRYDPGAAVPSFVAGHYLDLPPLTNRVRRLAVEWTRGLDNPVEMAQAIELRLASDFDYTLDLPPRGDDPIDHFLFVDRRGHCEFFSTAMVLMLRSLGVPARNVNGFQGGEWNDVGSYYIVRRLNAHSWVEAWIPGAGWVRFDPTPEASLPASRFSENTEDMPFIDQWFDYLQRSWRGWILDFDLGKQLSVFGGVEEGESLIGSTLDGLGSALATGWWRWLVLLGWCGFVWWLLGRVRVGWPVLLAGVIGAQVLATLLWPEGSVLGRLVGFCLPLWAFWRQRVARLIPRAPAPTSALGRTYRAIVDALTADPERASLAALPPGALGARLCATDDPLDREVGTWVSSYARARFGPRPDKGELAAWTARERALRQEGRALAKALRRSSR